MATSAPTASPWGDVLRFWFADSTAFRPAWFKTDPAFDDQIRAQFGGLVDEQLAAGSQPVCSDPQELLGRIIVLDQFPRNLFRGTARAFAGDSAAVALCKQGLESGAVEALEHDVHRLFALMPLQHSEELADQELGLETYARLLPGMWSSPGSAVRSSVEGHVATVRRFGRFPHRNAVLGRKNTPEEEDYLTNGTRQPWESPAPAKAAAAEAAGGAPAQ